MKVRPTVLAVLTSVLCGISVLHAETEYVYRVPLSKLQMDNDWPGKTDIALSFALKQRRKLGCYLPYASVDSAQAVIDFGEWELPGDLYRVQSVRQIIEQSSLVVKSPRKAPLSGVLFCPRPDLSDMMRVPFTITEATEPLPDKAGLQAFYTARQKHYDHLLRQEFTGDAWFRFQSIKAASAADRRNVLDPNTFQPQVSETRPDPFRAVYGLFTGEQAIRENIQLDRTLQVAQNQRRTVDLSSIQGITTAQIDWKPLISGRKIETDLLAAYIPADQHAIFYPTFRSMMELMDAIREGRQSLEPLGFSVDRLDGYEQQMCVWLDGWSRFWGPKTIRGVALTGSDPYMAEGTDSAILFDASIGGLVYGNTESKQKDKLKEIDGARLITGTVDGIDYRAVVSPDRRVSSWLAQIDNVVVVTNSLSQLRKIIRASHKTEPPMSESDEYKFFRDRYNLEQNEQTALLVLTDAAIRRWCSPRWRIGAARRATALALLSHAQAAWIDSPETFDLAQANRFLTAWIPDVGTVSLTDAGVTSSVYGNLLFQTPIAELPVDAVSPEEKQQYERFRQAYQRRWQSFFDPIAVCVLHEKRQSRVDLTVRPLIAESQYRQWMQIAGAHVLESRDGDPHPESIAHLVFAIDRNSEPVRQAGQMASGVIPGKTGIGAFDWLGRWIAVYVDEGPFWKQFQQRVQAVGMERAVEERFAGGLDSVPLAVAAQVENPVVLSAFLVSMRTWIEQTLPGMTAWQTLEYKDQAYTKVTVRMSAGQSPSSAVYYAVLPGQLLVSLDESMIERAVDRLRRPAKTADQWAGQNMAVRVNEEGWKVVELLANDSYAQWLQKKAWNSLPVLTEWHVRSGRMSEAEFHQRFWNPSLDCPAGTEYTWNKRLQAVESELFGHPAQSRMPAEIKTPLSSVKQADIGVTFEEDGLRAVIKVERKR